MAPPTKNILVTVTGQTPAIITETLWALEQQKGVRIDEIRIITTDSGKTAILSSLLGENGAFAQYCQDLNVPSGRLAFGLSQIYVLEGRDGCELSDIRNSQENAAAADQIFSFIQDWTSRPHEVIYGSVAGGRKTLGIYLAMALMLCGRSEDSLFHVLVNPLFESLRDFYYPPPTPRDFQLPLGYDQEGNEQWETLSSTAAGIELAEIPFLRLSESLGGNIPFETGYLEAVRHGRSLCRYLKDPPVLEVCLRCGLMRFGDFTISLTKQQLAVYVFFLQEFNSPEKWATLKDIFDRPEKLTSWEQRIDSMRLGVCESYAWKKVKSLEDIQEKLNPIISKINAKITKARGKNRVAQQCMIGRKPRFGVGVQNFHISLDLCQHS